MAIRYFNDTPDVIRRLCTRENRLKHDISNKLNIQHKFLDGYNALHNGIVDESGRAMMWGLNGNGQLGNGTNDTSTVPIAASGVQKFSSISCGGSHTIALDEDGLLWGWGHAYFGQLGIGTPPTENILTPVQSLEGHKFVKVFAGDAQSFGIKEDGSLWAWGRNDQYQLLIDGDDTDKFVPTRTSIQFPVRNAFYCYAFLGLYETPSGMVGCPNANEIVNEILPSWDSSIYGFQKTTSVRYGVIGLDNYGYAKAMGYNNQHGMLGVGEEYEFVTTPTYLSGNHTFVDIRGGHATHAIAMGTDGYIYTWGENFNGSLGLGIMDNPVWVPTAMANDHNFIALATGFRHSYGLKEDGSIWWWGYYSTLISSLTPVQLYPEII